MSLTLTCIRVLVLKLDQTEAWPGWRLCKVRLYRLSLNRPKSRLGHDKACRACLSKPHVLVSLFEISCMHLHSYKLQIKISFRSIIIKVRTSLLLDSQLNIR